MCVKTYKETFANRLSNKNLDSSTRTITFQGQANIATQAQSNNLTLSADSDIDTGTSSKATGIYTEDASNNNTLTFEQDALINTLANSVVPNT